MGYIDVTYDAEGKILAYHGAPIHLTNATEQNATLQTQIEAWRGPFEEFAAQVIGVSNVVLEQSTCQEEECLLGDFMADAMFTYRQNESDSVDFAIINAGGIRATIDAGNITRGEVLTSFPFGNSLVEVTMSGDDVWKVLEGVFSGVNQFNGEEVTSFPQVSRGIKIEYNPENESGSKLVSVTIGDSSLDREEMYNIVTLDFLAGGGDQIFTGLALGNTITLETQDEILVRHIESQSPVDISLDGRISAVSGTAPPSGDADDDSVEGGSSDSTNGTVPTTGDASGALRVHAHAGIALAGLLACIMVAQ